MKKYDSSRVIDLVLLFLALACFGYALFAGLPICADYLVLGLRFVLMIPVLVLLAILLIVLVAFAAVFVAMVADPRGMFEWIPKFLAQVAGLEGVDGAAMFRALGLHLALPFAIGLALLTACLVRAIARRRRMKKAEKRNNEG